MSWQDRGWQMPSCEGRFMEGFFIEKWYNKINIFPIYSQPPVPCQDPMPAPDGRIHHIRRRRQAEKMVLRRTVWERIIALFGLIDNLGTPKLR